MNLSTSTSTTPVFPSAPAFPLCLSCVYEGILHHQAARHAWMSYLGHLHGGTAFFIELARDIYSVHPFHLFCCFLVFHSTISSAATPRPISLDQGNDGLLHRRYRPKRHTRRLFSSFQVSPEVRLTYMASVLLAVNYVL